MAYRQTSQISGTTGRRQRLNQVAAINARLDYLPDIMAAKERKKQQAETVARTKEREAIEDVRYEKAEEFRKKQERTALGLEATKLGTTLQGSGGTTFGDVAGSLKSTFGGGYGGKEGAAAGQVGGPGNIPQTTTSGGDGSFFSSVKGGLTDTTLSSAIGSGLTGYGAAQIFSDKSERTKAGWGVLAGGLTGLLGGGGISGMLSGGFYGGLGGLLG